MVQVTTNSGVLPATRSSGKSAEPTRVLLVDDHPIIREGFKRLLERDGEFEVVGEVDSVNDAIDQLTRSSVDIVLMDVQLPGMNGVEGTRLVKALHPDVKVVIVSAYGKEYLLPAIDAGADGYLLKTQAPWDLAESMRQAASGQSPMDATLTRHLMDKATVGRIAEGMGMPTERQQDVLRLLADGITSKDMASRLNISPTTLKREFRNIFNLLGVNDRAHAVAEACRRSLI